LNKQEVAEGLEKVAQQLEERSVRATRLGWAPTSTYSHDSSPVIAQNMNSYADSAVLVSDVMNHDWGSSLNNA
jgi:hypothetical protein